MLESGGGTATLEMKHQYYNIRKQLEPYYHIMKKASKVILNIISLYAE